MNKSEKQSEPDFEPELGQFIFAEDRDAWEDYDARWACEGLMTLGYFIRNVRGDAFSITSNAGEAPFENDVFAMRTYCWCDGDAPGHEKGCPVNFEHKESGLKFRWYKHAERSLSSNKKAITRNGEWLDILADCITSVRVEAK